MSYRDVDGIACDGNGRHLPSTRQPQAAIDLAQLRALHEAATPGEWVRHPSAKKWVLLPIPEDADPNNDANAEFCVAAHNAFPALADRLEAAERDRDELRQALSGTQRDVVTLRGMVEHNAAEREARDARMKLGAAEYMESLATTAQGLQLSLTPRMLQAYAARLRREAGDNGAQ